MKALFSRGKAWFGGGALFCALCVFLFIGANWPSYEKVWRYHTPPPTSSSVVPSPSPTVLFNTALSPAQAEHADGIESQKISLTAPIIWDVPYSLTSDQLEMGVVHIGGTAYPGDAGNTVLFGHSSDYFWKHDPYASVFALLPKLTSGDDVRVWRDNKAYAYRVVKTELVAPTDLSVLNQDGGKLLTLITCYPIGTTWRRFIVRAALIE